MRTTRKDFEQPVKYTTVGYRIKYPYGKCFVNEDAESTANDGYTIATRSLALKALRQFIWSEHKNVGYTHDIADFFIEGRGYYEV